MGIAFYTPTTWPNDGRFELYATSLGTAESAEVKFGDRVVKVGEDTPVYREAVERLRAHDADDLHVGTWDSINRDWPQWHLDADAPPELQVTIMLPGGNPLRPS